MIVWDVFISLFTSIYELVHVVFKLQEFPAISVPSGPIDCFYAHSLLISFLFYSSLHTSLYATYVQIVLPDFFYILLFSRVLAVFISNIIKIEVLFEKLHTFFWLPFYMVLILILFKLGLRLIFYYYYGFNSFIFSLFCCLLNHRFRG